jgi:hypothetical protein
MTKSRKKFDAAFKAKIALEALGAQLLQRTQNRDITNARRAYGAALAKRLNDAFCLCRAW